MGTEIKNGHKNVAVWVSFYNFGVMVLFLVILCSEALFLKQSGKKLLLHP